MLLIWIFAGVVAGIDGEDCKDIARFNKCGETLQTNISSATNNFVLPLESLVYICWNGKDTVQCFLDGLKTCPNSKITFKDGVTQGQWNVPLVRALTDWGCQTPIAQAFKANYDCMGTAVKSDDYSTCLSNATAANPLGMNNLIPCGLPEKVKICITTHIGNRCKNWDALDFYLQWYYIKGKFESGCKMVNGAESLTMAGTFPLVGTIYIFLMLLL